MVAARLNRYSNVGVYGRRTGGFAVSIWTGRLMLSGYYDWDCDEEGPRDARLGFGNQRSTWEFAGVIFVHDYVAG